MPGRHIEAEAEVAILDRHICLREPGLLPYYVLPDFVGIRSIEIFRDREIRLDSYNLIYSLADPYNSLFYTKILVQICLSGRGL